MRILLVSLGILFCLACAFAEHAKPANVDRRAFPHKSRNLLQLLRQKRGNGARVRPQDYNFLNKKMRPLPKQKGTK